MHGSAGSGALASRLAVLLYFMAPAFVANMAPPFVKYWHGWNRPIDERRLGSHKTVCGFALGVAAAVATTLVQRAIGWRGGIVDYRHWLALGLLFGIGAMAGDSIKSFFKRRVGIAPGRPWIPFDQLDYVVGALMLVWRWARLAWSDVALIVLVSFIGHFVVTRIGYWLGVRDVKF